MKVGKEIITFGDIESEKKFFFFLNINIAKSPTQ